MFLTPQSSEKSVKAFSGGQYFGATTRFCHNHDRNIAVQSSIQTLNHSQCPLIALAVEEFLEDASEAIVRGDKIK